MVAGKRLRTDDLTLGRRARIPASTVAKATVDRTADGMVDGMSTSGIRRLKRSGSGGGLDMAQYQNRGLWHDSSLGISDDRVEPQPAVAN